MPIIPAIPIERISENAFHELDYQVMRYAFDVHNELGRFCDEKIYQNALREKCMAAGLEAATEFEVKLTHKEYSKSFFIDLLINKGTVYELKTAKRILEDFRSQTLDYLFMTNTRHGKLVNFRPRSVEHEFVSTTLGDKDRHAFSILDANWKETSKIGSKIKTLSIDLLSDWGAFLNTTIYQEAIYHFLGGEEALIQPVEIAHNNNVLGHQKIPIVNKSETFCLTSATKEINHLQAHLQRFLRNTRLETLYWINLNRFKIQFTTLEKKSFCP